MDDTPLGGCKSGRKDYRFTPSIFLEHKELVIELQGFWVVEICRDGQNRINQRVFDDTYQAAPVDYQSATGCSQAGET